jgi:hypothetical protein
MLPLALVDLLSDSASYRFSSLYVRVEPLDFSLISVCKRQTRHLDYECEAKGTPTLRKEGTAAMA